MTRRAPILAIIIIVFLSPQSGWTDYLEVIRNATIKSAPERDAQKIERVQSGTYLPLLEDGRQKNGYYHVQTISIIGSGWIYKTFVRRFAGEIPSGLPEMEPVNPLSDSTAELTAAQRIFATRHLRLGKPQAVYERVREGYVLAQNAWLKIPLWVQYELTRDELRGTAERNDDFKPDTSIPYGYRSELNDYRGSGYDRRHMAPAADMKRSPQIMTESYLLSNIAPLVGSGFNRDIWTNLEAAVRGWVEQRGTLTIITGPVFERRGNEISFQVIGENGVGVPTHFYKIVVDVNDPKKPDSLAFLIPNQKIQTNTDLSDFLISIDSIEKATGLGFLSALPVEVQRQLEHQKAQKIW